MERKTKIEMLLAFLVLLLFWCVFVFWSRQSANIQAPMTTQTITLKPSSTTTESTVSEASRTSTAVVVQETSAVTVARVFVERLGSYSSEAEAANLEDILPMATGDFQTELVALAKKARASVDGTYYGVSTLVMTTPRVVSATATATTLLLTTQREETRDIPGNSTIVYQEITVSLVKSGTTWLVSDYFWQ